MGRLRSRRKMVDSIEDDGSKKVWVVANVSLTLVLLLLTLNLFDVEMPTLGKSLAQLEKESLCVMKNWQGEYIVRNIDSCCLEKSRFVLSCQEQELYYMDKTLDRVCPTGDKIVYYFNNAGYQFCQKK